MADNFIWTNHVRERSYQRGITDSEVWSALRYPDNTEKSYDGSYKFYKNFAGRLVTIVARPQGSQWVIITTYTKETHSGAYKKYIQHSHSKQPLVQRLVFNAVVSLGNFLSKLFSSR